MAFSGGSLFDTVKEGVRGGIAMNLSPTADGAMSASFGLNVVNPVVAANTLGNTQPAVTANSPRQA